MKLTVIDTNKFFVTTTNIYQIMTSCSKKNFFLCGDNQNDNQRICLNYQYNAITYQIELFSLSLSLSPLRCLSSFIYFTVENASRIRAHQTRKTTHSNATCPREFQDKWHDSTSSRRGRSHRMQGEVKCGRSSYSFLPLLHLILLLLSSCSTPRFVGALAAEGTVRNTRSVHGEHSGEAG